MRFEMKSVFLSALCLCTGLVWSSSPSVDKLAELVCTTEDVDIKVAYLQQAFPTLFRSGRVCKDQSLQDYVTSHTRWHFLIDKIGKDFTSNEKAAILLFFPAIKEKEKCISLLKGELNEDDFNKLLAAKMGKHYDTKLKSLFYLDLFGFSELFWERLILYVNEDTPRNIDDLASKSGLELIKTIIGKHATSATMKAMLQPGIEEEVLNHLLGIKPMPLPTAPSEVLWAKFVERIIGDALPNHVDLTYVNSHWVEPYLEKLVYAHNEAIDVPGIVKTDLQEIYKQVKTHDKDVSSYEEALSLLENSIHIGVAVKDEALKDALKDKIALLVQMKPTEFRQLIAMFNEGVATKDDYLITRCNFYVAYHRLLPTLTMEQLKGPTHNEAIKADLVKTFKEHCANTCMWDLLDNSLDVTKVMNHYKIYQEKSLEMVDAESKPVRKSSLEPLPTYLEEMTCASFDMYLDNVERHEWKCPVTGSAPKYFYECKQCRVLHT